MPNMLIRDLPEDVHAALQEKARRQGRSLQQYVAEELRRLASRRDIGEIIDAIERHEGGVVGFDSAVENVHAERGRR